MFKLLQILVLNLSLVFGTNGGLVPSGGSSNIGLPQYESHSDSSATRETLTAGTLILNKDSKPIITTPEVIGINTELHLANEQIEKPKDIQRMLSEQQATAEATANIGALMDTYTRRQVAEL